MGKHDEFEAVCLFSIDICLRDTVQVVIKFAFMKSDKNIQSKKVKENILKKEKGCMTLLTLFYLHWLRIRMTCQNHRVTARLELLPEPYILHIYLFIELTRPYPLIPKYTYMHDGFACRVSKICNQGSSEFTSRLLRRGDGTPASILNKVIFIWRLNLAAASTPAAVYSSRIMDMVSWKLRQKKPPLCSITHALFMGHDAAVL